jgi:SAM-dependent methyltransferase|tara:strand:+ start:2739 stop:3968 length:1230 start_codon:yes stop_codon:yes gene_type:complete
VINCRHCKTPLEYTFLDLGCTPPSNSYLVKEDLNRPEVHLPLKIKVCNQCWLVQTEDYIDAESLFSPEYSYFSSTSKSFLLHAKNFTDKIIKTCDLKEKSFVIEIASNDGYLLKNFIEKNIPCLGIEPTKSTAEVAEKLNIPVLRKFFSEALAKKLVSEGKKSDLIIGNNVYAHVPDINDFTKGLKTILKPGGIITLEFPHLMRLIEQTQFDTIYHEHFSYLSLYTVSSIFSHVGLRVWHVEEISTHGGSLRVYGCHQNDKHETRESVYELLKEEATRGLQDLKTYINFKERVNKIKDDLVLFLIEQKGFGNKVVAYGAAAKGNTILNYAGVKNDLLDFVVDKSTHKQGKFLPASRIPVVSEEKIIELKPEYVLILPWNIKDEIIEQLSYIREWEGKFVVAIPEIKIIK